MSCCFSMFCGMKIFSKRCYDFRWSSLFFLVEVDLGKFVAQIHTQAHIRGFIILVCQGWIVKRFVC